MQAQDARPLRVGGVPEHFNLPWHLAIDSGALARQGVDVDWAEYSTGTGAMLADLAAEQLDAAVVLTEGAAFGLARGLPIRAVSLYTTTPLIWGVHVPPAAHLSSIADLRGRRFGISRPGSGSHLMSLALAIEQGWPVDAMEFEVVDDLDGAVEAFRQGRAEVFLWEHFTTAPLVDSGVFHRIGDFRAPWAAWVVCVTSRLWQSDRERIERVVEIVAAQAQILYESPNRAALIGRRYGLEEAAVEQWLGQTRWVTGLTSPTSALADAHAMLVAAGAIAA